MAVLPSAVGLSGADYESPAAFTDGYRLATYACAGLLVVGALLAATTVRNDAWAGEAATEAVRTPAPAVAGASSGSVDSATETPAARRPEPQCRTHCAVGAPPLEPARHP